MERQRWKQIRDVLERAVGLGARERDDFLAQACKNDCDMRAEVEAILAASENIPEFFKSLAAGADDAGKDGGEPASLVGHEIGPYRLERFIASGGMGSVFRALRTDDPHAAAVAIKLIKQRAATSETLRRFHVERRALGTLSHPNIARLIDAGVTERGLPYIAMEYVDGEPIDVFCDQRRVALEQRLKLFCTVCSAVSYAHQKLIVHRDLKPSNILVTPGGTPKLLDFGIAKMLDPLGPGEAGDETLTRYRVMTPEYAAPEQIRGEYAATSSDVYSLGVVLYELLTGHRPYRFRTRTPHEMERTICEQEPERPSTAILRTAERVSLDGSSRIKLTPDSVSQARNDQPDGLRRRLAGDLDAIVMQSLRKESDHRYSSVEFFSEDIRRHLGGLPVHARKGTLRYRVSKFVRRNKAAVTAAMVAIVSLLAGLVAALWQGQIAIRAQIAAETEARKATSINAFLQDMLATVDPLAAESDEATVRRILDDASQKLSSGALDDQPEAKAAVLITLGRTYLELGAFDHAGEHLNHALKIRVGLSGREHRDVAECLDGLGMLAKARGRHAEAETFYRESLEIRQELLGDEHVDVAESLNNLGVLLKVQGRLDDAETMLRQALKIRRSTFGPHHEDVATTSSNLAAVLKHFGRFDDAEPLYREAIETYRQLLGPQHLRVAVCMNNLALLLRETGDLEEAEELLRHALGIRRKALGDEHPAVATGLHNLALMLHLGGDLVKAELMYVEALQIRTKTLGADHPSVANSANNLAELLASIGRFAEAELMARQALEIRHAKLPKDHPRVAGSLLVLGKTLLWQGDAVSAQPLLREALAISTGKLSAEHRQVVTAQMELGSCLTILERFDEAEALLLTAYANMRKESVQTNTVALRSKLLERLVDLYAARGDPTEAARYAAERREIGNED